MAKKVQKQYLHRLMHTSPLASESMYGCWLLARYFLCDGSFGSERDCHLFARVCVCVLNAMPKISICKLQCMVSFFNCHQPLFCLALMSQCLISINHIARHILLEARNVLLFDLLFVRLAQLRGGTN